ncbi:hypothetical protein RND71_031108 [Anisodus tanguticus]|uniref:Uncharacterized protein n=1 Tax=Anisodus tanguticus TaxID=243964 RepID=A0AAE1UX83_9SOLA|nr:hypothetical protein RND71_031108 [Anisodus tanguticus]
MKVNEKETSKMLTENKHMFESSGGTTLTNSSRSIMRSGSSSRSTKRKHSDGPAKSNDQSIQDSGRSGLSALISSGSFDQSQDQKSMKKRKIDG